MDPVTFLTSSPIIPSYSLVSSHSGLISVPWTSWPISHWPLPLPGPLFSTYLHGSFAVISSVWATFSSQKHLPWPSYLRLHTLQHWVLPIPFLCFIFLHSSYPLTYYIIIYFFNIAFLPPRECKLLKFLFWQEFLFCSLMYLQHPHCAWDIVSAQ